jgi:hypothetical protein
LGSRDTEVSDQLEVVNRSDDRKTLTGIEENVKFGLTRIVIPSDMLIIWKDCFSGCESLCEVTFES